MANAISSDIPFAMPLRCGFLMEPQPISLANGGLKITLQLANDAQVLYGLSAQGFVYELRDLFLSGSYLVLDQPVAPEKGQLIESLSNDKILVFFNELKWKGTIWPSEPKSLRFASFICFW